MDLNKLAEEQEKHSIKCCVRAYSEGKNAAESCTCDRDIRVIQLTELFARVQADERERCARVFTDSPHIARILAALDEGPDDRDDGPMCRLCHQLMSVSDEYEPHAICWLCATKSVDELADAIRALNNAQGEQARMKEFSFCESAHATGYGRWHIRPLTEVGRKLGGGADRPSLCGRTMGWDLDVPLTEHHLSHACSKCVVAYREQGAQG